MFMFIPFGIVLALFTFIAVHSHFALDDIHDDKRKKVVKNQEQKQKTLKPKLQ